MASIFKYKLLLISFAFLQLLGYAQQIDKIIPPSPNVASLLTYAQIPVSKYTGVPDINIPLYTVKSGNLELPISLSYHSGGIKVMQDASWVGLGWALNAGGVITRAVRGMDDFDPDVAGYYTTSYPLNNPYDGMMSVYWNYLNTTMLEYMNGTKDAEPDIFYLNAGPITGKFYILKQDSGGEIYATSVDQSSNIKIRLLPLEKSFIVTDGNGNKYYFGTKEYSYSQSSTFPQKQSDNYELTVWSGFCEDNRTIDAWYLDSMVSMTGDKISFLYVKPSSECDGVLSPTQLSQTKYTIAENGGPFRYFLPGFATDHTYSRTVTEEVLLSSIVFDNGYVDFVTGSRLDIQGYGSYAPQKLQEMRINLLNHQTLETVYFEYSYFNSATDRLRLDKLYIDNQPYIFSYNNDQLPNKKSLSVDHWGFNNGKNNSMLLPRNGFGGGLIDETLSANRDPDEAYAKAGILEQIEYPTGGKTTFTFESNEFYSPYNEYATLNYFKEASNNYYINTQNPFEQIDFYVPPGINNAAAEFNLLFTSMSEKTCDEYLNMDEVFALLISIPSENASLYDHISDYWANNGSGFNILKMGTYTECENNQITGHLSETFTLAPGWYRVVLEPAHYFVASAVWNVTYVSGINENRKGGGLRVKEIRNTDSRHGDFYTKYAYKDKVNTTRSSGVAMSTPIYKTSFTVLEPPFLGAPGVNNPCSVIRSSSLNPLSSAAQGSFIGYSRVTETLGEQGENGSIETYYANDYVGDWKLFVPSPESVRNGLVDSEVVYNAAGSVVKRVSNVYDIFFPARKTFFGCNFLTFPFMYDLHIPIGLTEEQLAYIQAQLPPEGYANNYMLYHYERTCDWFPLKSSTEKLYTSSGIVSTTTEYEYNLANRQVSLIKKTLSNGDKVIEKYKYPVDYSSSAGTIYASMKTANLINPRIETQTWRQKGSNYNLIGSTVTNFKEFGGNGFIAPFIFYNLKTTAPLSSSTVGETPNSTGPYNNLLFNNNYFDTKTTYDYAGGRIKEIAITDNVTKSYIWGYNNAYPIAEVSNAKQKDIFHTSFEDTEGNSTDSKTGRKSRTGGYTKSLSNLTGGRYILSYWQKTGSNWNFQRTTVSVTSAYTINLSGQVDEVRFYPENAQMSTYTYDLIIGITSETDTNDRSTYYEYDSFGRLIHILDNDRNVIKKMEYKYRLQ